MPRSLRIEYENAWYHVMNRGANRQKIFKTDEHRNLFLNLLSEISYRFNIEIHAYCLMDNHYHLVICTPFANLAKAMRHLNGIYTQKFNTEEKRDGSLFRGRYKAILVESDKYLLQLSRYIHLNPVKAKVCINPVQYRWSSLQFYAKKDNLPPWLKINTILEQVDKNNFSSSYMEFIYEGIDNETDFFYNKKQLSSILGSKKFIASILAKVKEQFKIPCSPDIKRTQYKPEIDDILETVKNHFQIDQTRLNAKTPGKTNIEKMIAIYLASHLGQLSHSKIATRFNLCSESVGAILKRCTTLLKNNQLKNHIDAIIQKLSE